MEERQGYALHKPGYQKHRKRKLFIFYRRHTLEITANGQGSAREGCGEREKGPTMCMVVSRALTPTKRGNVWGPGTAYACYFVGSIKCS